MPKKVLGEIGFPSPFPAVAKAVAGQGSAARFAKEQAWLWREVAEQVPNGGRGLIVTHGLFIECGAVACLPDADHASWGEPIAYCEGIRLHYDGDWLSGTVLRLPQDKQLIEN